MTPDEMRALAERLGLDFTDEELDEAARALRQAADYQDRLRQALEYALHAIDTGKSEPLFAAQDLIRNTLQGGPNDT